MKKRLAMVQVDVFASRALEGNPLAVFLSADGLSDSEMQAIAKEMNLSETTFVFRRDPRIEQQRGVRVRIFTVGEELPFAGHPTLGTAFVLRGDSGAAEIALDLNVGTIPVSFEKGSDGQTFGEMRQRDPEFGAQHDREQVAQITGLAADDFESDLPIQTVSTGVPFTIAPLRRLETIQQLRIDHARAAEYLEQTGGKFFFFVTRQTVDPAARLHARMIFYNGEDPATGSASGCAAAWMARYGVAKPDERVLIEQGLEMKRPSRIFVRASRSGDRVTNVRVGGHTVEVMRGELIL
jgi:trans-2,3-dihydro-3-hydroxyanthranilate isomerase